MNPEELFIMEAEDVTASFCLCVLVVFMFVAVFLFPRINIDSPLARAQVPIVPELAMVGARNPFAVKILNPDLASVKDGIKLRLETSVYSELHALWVVSCSSLQQALHDCSIQLLHDASRSLRGHFLHRNHPVILAAETETDITLTLPETVTDTQIQAGMGPPPRTKYPLCLVVRALQRESQTDSRPRIVGAVYILHLPDDTFRDRCRLISQLIISDTGQVCDLQKLYMAAEGNYTPQNPLDLVSNSCDSEDSFTQDVTESIDPAREETNSGCGENSADTNDSRNGCVVCKNGSISIALLPCRHTCICTSCFPLLNRCPMCRGCIESFFPLNCGMDADWARTHYAVDDGEEDDDWATKFNSSCDRLNRWLGLVH